ncbi:MAG TPA: uracil-DNA glycosylase [Candidatus Cloacimonadota bacterium]|nr:uracil-DNA glycosylase [Candidatus Cloacimonadota bacterium]HPT72663.1 uracil-DNA glycosylase [Candidatus Cloacimonadota bacterium]
MDTKSLQQFIEMLQLSGVDEIYRNSPSRLLAELKAQYENCTKCGLSSGRLHLVYGEGDPHAKLMVIGEGPGEQENLQGRPFVGPAGELLNRMLEAIQIKRSDVYICNIVKCRPPGNRDPLPEESEACVPYLLEQMSVIRPRLLLLLGRVAAITLLKQEMTLGQFRSEIREFQGIPTYVTYHPSALLRNPEWKKFAWEDLKKLKTAYELVKDEPPLN